MEQMNVPQGDEPDVRVLGQTKSFWKRFLIIGGVLLAAVVIAIIIVFTTTSPATQTETETEVKEPRRSIELHEAFSPDLIPVKFHGQFGFTKYFYVDESNNLMALRKMNHNISQVLPSNLFNFKNIHSWSVSGDNNYIMLVENYIAQTIGNGHTATYRVIHLESLVEYPITRTGKLGYIDFAMWSPVGSSLVFVEEGILYYKSTVMARPSVVKKPEGSFQHIGTCDFIYQREIFFSEKAIWFSPDGSTVAFAIFDDKYVTNMHIPIYGEPGSIESQYPTERVVQYPKTGTKNPIVSLRYFATNNLPIDPSIAVPLHEAHPSEVFSNMDYILTGVSWATNVQLVAMWTNRAQNLGIVSICAVGNCHDVKSLTEANGWLEPNQGMHFHKLDGNDMAMIELRQLRNGLNYSQITMTDLNYQQHRYVIIGEEFNVKNIVHWNADENVLFFHGNKEKDSYHSHLYTAPAAYEIGYQCLTCNISVNGILQTNFRAEFDDFDKQFVLHILGPSIPSVHLYAWSVGVNHFVNINKTHTFEENSLIHEKMKNISVPVSLYHDVPLSIDGMSARVKLIVPEGVDLDGRVKFPLLVFANAAPNSYEGGDTWSSDWKTYLASNKSVVTAIIDARGSGRRSSNYRFAGYRNLGTVEVEDQIEVAEKLGKLLPYIDESKIGIWGSGYGGYVSVMALAKDTNKVFRCAASVSGITDWQYYNSMYTERYMGQELALDNLEGYKNSSLLSHIEQLRGKSLFLVHGTLDDDVHYQQMMMLVKKLETSDVPFQQMSYADGDHTLLGSQFHLYQNLNKFFGDCFGVSL